MIRINGKTRLVGVVGWPVEHTLSPPMQNAAIEHMGLNWVYVPLAVPPEGLAAAVAGARAMGFIGLNFTIPHKHAVLELADRVDPTAKMIGAANTLHFTEEGTLAFNTDAAGFVRTVEQEAEFDFKGKHMVQIGAGGVGRAMAFGAAKSGLARLTVYNRNPERAGRLIQELAIHHPGMISTQAESLDELVAATEHADLVANATSLGMNADDPLPLAAVYLRPHHVVFDTVYSPFRTPLLEVAERHGARTVSGLGMLARQGARALWIWSGLQPDEHLMIEVLRQRLDIG